MYYYVLFTVKKKNVWTCVNGDLQSKIKRAFLRNMLKSIVLKVDQWPS